MKKPKGNEIKLRPESFIPPEGHPRTPAPDQIQDCIKKAKEIGAFSRHMYDLDICTLYRQMDDLRGRYKYYAGHKYADYVKQIRDLVGFELKNIDLDVDFYRDHFYCTLKADRPSYFLFLGLFFSLSDPLLLVPKLEFHLSEFMKEDAKRKNEESFLVQLEFTVCNAIRTARFPEDYFVKHDRIINWIYSKRDEARKQAELNLKLEAIIAGINRISPQKKLAKEIVKVKQVTENKLVQTIRVEEDRVEVLVSDLQGYVKDLKLLRKLLRGEITDSSVICFNGMANQLIDVFRIYCKDQFVNAEKRTVAKWICTHFMYWDDHRKSYVPFDLQATGESIYRTDSLAKKNRILLSGLPHPRSSYYVKRERK